MCSLVKWFPWRYIFRMPKPYSKAFRWQIMKYVSADMLYHLDHLWPLICPLQSLTHRQRTKKMRHWMGKTQRRKSPIDAPDALVSSIRKISLLQDAEANGLGWSPAQGCQCFGGDPKGSEREWGSRTRHGNSTAVRLKWSFIYLLTLFWRYLLTVYFYKFSQCPRDIPCRLRGIVNILYFNSGKHVSQLCFGQKTWNKFYYRKRSWA